MTTLLASSTALDAVLFLFCAVQRGSCSRPLPRAAQRSGHDRRAGSWADIGLRVYGARCFLGLAFTGFFVIGRNSQPNVSGSERGEDVAEALIRQRVEDCAKAVRAKEIDRVMSFYAPDIVSFDINPPLRYTGADNKRGAWQDFFATYTGPVAYEVRDLNVTTAGELALVHSLNHLKGTLASGHVTDLWVRWTACFRRINGVWLVVHDHVSVPADLKHGQAVLNLTP
jgi:ketosteroid isomerase-like protein